MDSDKSDYVPRRPTPIGNPNNLLDDDSNNLDESEIKPNMITSNSVFQSIAIFHTIIIYV